MAKQQQNDTQLLNDEFTKIFDAYRAKIDQITRHTQKNLTPEEAAPEPPPAVAPEKPQEAVSQTPQEPVKTPETTHGPVKIEMPAFKESKEMLNKAKKQAQQIIEGAEESVRKEAKKKTQLQVEKILNEARQEAEDIVSKATQSVEAQRAEAAAILQKENEQVIREITEKCREAAQAQSNQIITETREKATKMLNEIIANSTEIGRQLDVIINKAKKTIGEFEERLQADAGELAKVISETQQKLLQITMVIKEEERKPATAEASPAGTKEPTQKPTLLVHLRSNNSNGKESDDGLFRGQVEMKSASAFDYQYLKNLKKYLIQIPSMKYLQESASEKEISVSFDIKEPVPLLDIFNSIPMIDEVIIQTSDDICLVFKNTK